MIRRFVGKHDFMFAFVMQKAIKMSDYLNILIGMPSLELATFAVCVLCIWLSHGGAC